MEDDRRHSAVISKRKTFVDNLAVFKYKGREQWEILESTDPALILLKVITEELGYLTHVKQRLQKISNDNTINKNKEDIVFISIMNAWYELFVSLEKQDKNRNILNFCDKVDLGKILSWISDNNDNEIIGSAARGFYLAFNRYSYQALWEVLLSDVKLKDKQETIPIWYEKGNLSSILASLSCSLLQLWYFDMANYSTSLIRLHLLMFINMCQDIILTDNLIKVLLNQLEIPENVINIHIIQESVTRGDINKNIINPNFNNNLSEELTKTVYCYFDDISILSSIIINNNENMFYNINIWLMKLINEEKYGTNNYNNFQIIPYNKNLKTLVKLSFV